MRIRAVICHKCMDVVYSRARHDFHYCTCGATGVDDGPGVGRSIGAYHDTAPHFVEVAASKAELYDDWNRRLNRFGRVRLMGSTLPVLVGQAPGPRTDPGRPLVGSQSGQRLAALCGLPEDGELAARFHLMNLLNRWPGRDRRGCKFSIDRARRQAVGLDFPGSGPIVLLGTRVAATLGVKEPYFKWTSFRHRHAVVIPHPSGISLWWNRKRNVDRATAFMTKLVEGWRPEMLVTP